MLQMQMSGHKRRTGDRGKLTVPPQEHLAASQTAVLRKRILTEKNLYFTIL